MNGNLVLGNWFTSRQPKNEKTIEWAVMNRSIAATIIGIVVAVGLALLTRPEWLLDFLPTRRIGPKLIFTFVMVSSHYLESE